MARKKAAKNARNGSSQPLARRFRVVPRSKRWPLELYGVIRAALKNYGLSPDGAKKALCAIAAQVAHQASERRASGAD